MGGLNERPVWRVSVCCVYVCMMDGRWSGQDEVGRAERGID